MGGRCRISLDQSYIDFTSLDYVIREPERNRILTSCCASILLGRLGMLRLLGKTYLLSIDDLRKSRGLHSVSAYRSMSAGVAQSSHAFVGGTVSTWAR